MDDQVTLHRPAIPPSAAPLLDGSSISFLHPGYPAPINVLLSLPRVDPSCHGSVLGVHHGTALVACQTVADNAFDNGYLALDARGTRRVEEQVPLDGVLAEGQYYFVVEGDGTLPLYPGPSASSDSCHVYA